MVHKTDKGNWRVWICFSIFLLSMLVINFTGAYFGLTHFYWHFFLHIGIIIFSFLILIYSLKLNEKGTKYVIIGSVLWITINCILFLAHVFEEYVWLGENLFMFLGMIIGILIIMQGFKEATK